MAGEHAYQVMKHEDLPVAVGARPDPDRRHAGEASGDFGGNDRRYHLHYHEGGACLFERKRVRLQARRAIFGPSLDAIAAELVHRLRCQANMSADRHAAFDQKVNRVRHERAAFELDHLRSRGHQPGGVSHRLLAALLIAAERHVRDNEWAIAAARDALGVIHHVLEGHREGRLLPLQDVAQRVADQDDIDPASFQQRCEACVVTG